MSDTSNQTEKKTGIFYVKNPAGVVVMEKGQVIARYTTISEFVRAHKHGIHAQQRLEEQMERDIANQYTPFPKDN